MKIGRYVIGLLSGLTFGMLFAPRRGKDLREEILEKGSEDRMEGFKVLGHAFKGAGEDAMRELKDLAGHEDVAALLGVSQDKMKQFLDTAEEKGYDVAAFVQEKLEALASLAKKRAENVQGDLKETGKSLVKKAVSQKRVYKSAKKAKK